MWIIELDLVLCFHTPFVALWPLGWGGGHERVSPCLLSFTMGLASLRNPSDPGSHLMGVFPGIIAFHLHTEPTAVVIITVIVIGRSSSTCLALTVCRIQPCISLSNFQNNTNDSDSSPREMGVTWTRI